jgi:predicted AlkP superfamily pyrophosphatase or phosphodiesterase
MVQEPFKYFSEGTNPIPATHGSPYSYDTHVPLIIMGHGVAAGRYAQPATPADIAPTLASILRVQVPSNSVGRVLLEGLSK